jgi:hypothetical protein
MKRSDKAAITSAAAATAPWVVLGVAEVGLMASGADSLALPLALVSLGAIAVATLRGLAGIEATRVEVTD